MADSNFCLPCFWRYQPFPFDAVSPAPAGTIVNGAILGFDGLKPRISVLFDKQPHLRNCSLIFAGLPAAPALAPVNEASTRRFYRISLLPGYDTQFAS